MRKAYSEMTLAELRAEMAQKQATATAMYKDLMKNNNKQELLSQVNQLERIHSCSERDPKSELASYIVHLRVWSGVKNLNRAIEKAEALEQQK